MGDFFGLLEMMFAKLVDNVASLKILRFISISLFCFHTMLFVSILISEKKELLRVVVKCVKAMCLPNSSFGI